PDGADATSRAAASRPEDAEPQVAAPGGRVGAAAAVPVAPTTSAATHEADGAPRDPAPVQTTGTAAPESPVRTGAPAAAPPPAATAGPRPPLVPQLVPHVTALAAAGDGDHEVTLTVSPEDLGPVTVRARISGDTMRIELFSPSDVGRDALRLVLADLRRDLAIAAPHATLSLATGEPAPSAGHSSPQSSTHTGADGSQAGRDGAPQQSPRDGSPHAARDRAERPSPGSRPGDADGGHARAATDSPLPSNGWAAAASFDVLA
ncbi:flagellar hook-length control protein FliK, partial [Microbacterium marinilacus]|uniref:flagellar hook-length control protein FliK n=1 Tax=Microbacterium marinilacus TaxID=415209 RepID=UPI0031D288DC